jgi:hypothetical protein
LVVWASVFGVLSVVLLAFSAWATVVGLMGGMTRERIERCARCHRYGVTVAGHRHADGCPTHLADRVVRLWQLRPRDVHLRHH